MTDPTDLTTTIIILNWNGRPYLQACLDAVFGQERLPERIVLVDNASTDDSLVFVREYYPSVEVRESGGNIGFAAGNNIALSDLSTDIALLLNPDVLLSPDCLAVIVEAMAADPSIGIAGCKLWYPDGVTIQHGGGIVTHPRAMPGHFGLRELDEGQCDESRDVDYVIGAALAVRGEVLDRIGLLDEGFFLFFEDTDLCTRVARANYRVVYLPAATGIHIESVTVASGSFNYLVRFHISRWRYLLKHFAIEEILGPTFPEEADWLERLGLEERRAAGLAYLATRRQLFEILAARERDGASPFPVDAQPALETGLANLQAAARLNVHSPETIHHLTLAAALWQEPPVAKNSIRQYIAKLRTLWGNIATRWHMRYYVARQNEFNRLVVVRIKELELEPDQLLALLEEQIVITSEHQRRIQDLQARINELREEIRR